VKGAKSAVEDLLAKHRKQEEGRWEVRGDGADTLAA
jgi:hypothetical protein